MVISNTEEQIAHRAMNIANQTGNMEKAIVTSLRVSQLMEKLYNGIAKFEFIKKSTGERRLAWGTLSENLISEKVKGCKRTPNPNIICYYDVERGEFRSFLIQNLLEVY